MRVFVTGIEGFLGRHLARALAERGHEVSGSYFDQAPPSDTAPSDTAPSDTAPSDTAPSDTAPSAAAPLLRLDLAQPHDAARIFAVSSPEVVVHLAGLSHVGRSWSAIDEYYRANVLGAEHVFEAAPERCRIVFASSAEVYGRVPPSAQPIAESRAVSPITPYGLTKAVAERSALRRRALVVRSFNLIGPGQSKSFALPGFAEQLGAIARGEREAVLYVGDLTAQRDFVNVVDGAAAYALLIERGQPGEVYNLASGRAVSIRFALERLLELSGVVVRIERDAARDRPVDNPLVVGDPTRLRSLGFQPTLGLDQALRNLWEEASRPRPRDPTADR